jgi:hypothetical protein
LLRSYRSRFFAVHTGDHLSNQATSLESQTIPLIQYLPGQTLSISRYMGACAQALDKWQIPPPSETTAVALAACAFEIASMRSEGVTRPLTAGEVEQLFALGFAFEELRRNLADLERSVRDWTRV